MPVTAPPKILIVDDDLMNLEILEDTLEDLDLSFVRATSGEMALALMEENDVALVLMDVQMPGMDGFETVRRMRKVAEWSLIPVIFITAVFKENDAMVEGIETGAVDFLPKPFDYRVLQGKVRILVDLYRERKRLEEEIQRRKLVEGELLAAKEAAEEASRSKSEFLANMSHDIRTPMNAILGMADMLRETRLNDEQKKYINIFQSAGRNLLGLINDILDLSKIENGEVTYEKEAFNIFELVENTSEMFALTAHEKGLELVVFVHPDVPETVIGDSVRLRQVLSNMIGNAVKFTQHGEVVVVVRQVPSIIKIADLNRVELEFAVHDTGIGIPEESLHRIFSSFQQGDSSTTRKYGGTGLGLTISRKLVEGMGGDIAVDSEPGRGSCFSFRCHFDFSESDKDRESVQPALKERKVMILCRNIATCRMMTDTISAWGGAVELLEPGEDPLMKFYSTQTDGGPMIVVIDGRLHEMMNFELLRLISAHPIPTATLMVLLTTENSHEKIKTLKALGVNHYIIKPLKCADLRNNFRMMLGISSPDLKRIKEMETTTSETKKSPKNILLVDDSEDNRLLIKVYLKKTDHSLTMAENGEEGVAKFKAGYYDLVLMDIHMPVMDGIEATGKIREWEINKGRQRTRIIALTANAMEEDEQVSLNAGCDYHLTKPISKVKLLETIEENP